MIFMALWPWEPSPSPSPSELRQRRIALAIAAVTVLIRPTSAVLWTIIGAIQLKNIPSTSRKARLLVDVIWIGYAPFAFVPWRLKLDKQIHPPRLSVLSLGAVVDYLYYGRWVLTIWNFLEFNVIHDAAALYGVHPWHWYFSNGILVVIGPFLLLVVAGIVTSSNRSMAIIAYTYVTLFSFNLHKEFRFVDPLWFS